MSGLVCRECGERIEQVTRTRNVYAKTDLRTRLPAGPGRVHPPVTVAEPCGHRVPEDQVDDIVNRCV